MLIRAQYYYDSEGKDEVAKVKIFQDNKLFEELNTSKKGKFKILLPLGHDYLFEVSKEFHFTTKAIISTKLPPEKMNSDTYVSFDLEGDLIRNYVGLDGSIMDKPILILRYIPEADGFSFDEDHLNAVRSRVERLVMESDKLSKKGADPIAKPLPKMAKKAEMKKPEPKKDTVIEETQMISGNTHDSKEVAVVEKPKAEPIKKKVPETVVEEKEETKEDANETYEMQLRRQRLEKEKKRKENLALKRGYESSLIRQVAEENRKMSRAEVEKKTQQKEDASLLEKARKETEMKKAKSALREEQEVKQQQASNNKQTKSRMESGMIREVAASSKKIQAIAISGAAPKGEETAAGKKFVLDPDIREDTDTDDFKKVENLYLDYPSYRKQFSKETYNFGMVNYYIDNQAVEKETFCKSLNDLKSYKFKLSCD